MRNAIFKMLLKLSGINAQPSQTEKAFEALHELEKMQMFIERNNLSDNCAAIPTNVVRFYKVKNYTAVWKALTDLQFKNKPNYLPQ